MNTILAFQVQGVLDAAQSSPHGILIKIHSKTDTIQLSSRGRQILYRFKNLSENHKNLQIYIMSDDELWIVKQTEGINQ